MIPFETVVVTPARSGTPAHQIRDGLHRLAARLHDAGGDTDDVLALTIFVAAGEPTGYPTRRAGLLGVVRDQWSGDPPPTTIVAQAPEGRRDVLIEATVLAAPATVTRRTWEGQRYTLVTSGGVRQVFGGGISSPACAGTDVAARSAAALASVGTVLRRERMDFGHVVRQWNYLEEMLAIGPDGRQGYQAFNDVRASVYGHATFPNGYPAATGIGQAAGGVTLAFVALDAPRDVAIDPLSNPRQTDAHRYSPARLVGEAAWNTPKFERAKRIRRGENEIVFVSGTAAIVGERSVATGDVAAQTRTTIDNIGALVGARRLTSLRAYVKRRADLHVVRRLCESAFGKVPAAFVTADVCRDELLVELEGTVVVRSPAPVGGP